MSKIYNISDRLSKGKPSIQVGEVMYEVNNDVDTVIFFDETLRDGISGIEGMLEAFKIAVGEKAYKAINPRKLPQEDFKVYVTAVIAAMQGIDFDEAASRFQDDNEE